jgi:hypothetical protein
MPIAREIAAVQFGCVGLWLWNRFEGRGLAAIGVLGAINIPYYEEMARRINWWQYRDCRMPSYTPYYIILSEFGIAVLLTILAKRLVQGNWTTALLSTPGRSRRWSWYLHLLRHRVRHHRRHHPSLVDFPRTAKWFLPLYPTHLIIRPAPSASTGDYPVHPLLTLAHVATHRGDHRATFEVSVKPGPAHPDPLVFP